MSNLLKSKFLLGVMVVAALAVGVAVSATTASADCSITTTLRVGSKGAEVMCLQTKVGATSDGSFGPMTKASVMAFQASHGLSSDGVVGPMTRAVLNGVVSGGSYPAGCTSTSGFSSTTGMSCSSGGSFPAGCTSTSGFSSTTGMSCSSGGSFPAGCSSSSGYSVTTGMSCSGGSSPSGPLTGGAGSLDDVEGISSLADEEIAESSSDAKIAGWTFTADNGSDLAITSMKLEFELTAGGGSDKLDDYAESVSVWQGSTKIGSADVSDFSENSNVYSKTFNLTGAVVRADQDSDFFVAVDVLSNVDSDDLSTANNTWTLTLVDVRYQDATGAIITDSTTGDIGLAGEPDFHFASVADTEGIELKVSTTTGSAGDAVNEAHIVEVDATSDTNDVPLLAFDLEATGDVKNIQDIPVGVVVAGTGDIDEVVSRFTLWMDGTEIDSVSVADGTADNYTGGSEDVGCLNDSCGIHFDDIDFDMDDGDTAHFVVKADINEVDGDPIAEGDNLTVTINGTATDDIDAEDSSGDSLGNDERAGTATAEAVSFYTEGITVALVGTPTAVVSNDGDASSNTSTQTGTFTIKFEVTAFGDDMRIDDDADEDTSTFTTVTQLSYSLSNDAAMVDTSTTNSLTSSSGATHDTESFLVEEGTTETFVLTVAVQPEAAGSPGSAFTDVKLEGIGWTAGSADAVGANIYTFNLDDYKTPQLYLIEYD